MSAARRLLVFLAALAVGGTFVAAGTLKALDVEGFARDIELHRIIGPALSAIAARGLIPFEIAAGAAAIVGYRRRLALGLLAAALLFFIAGTGWAWWHGNTEGCGCFGRFASRTPLSVIVEDALLLAAAALGIVLDRTRGTARPERPARRLSWRGALVGALGLAAAVMALASPSLPIDGIATALRPGVDLHALGLDAVAGGLAERDRLLVILVLDDPRSQQAVPALNRLTEAPGVPRLTALTSADEQARSAFFFEFAPAFDLLEVPSADLRRLYRRAPRSFRVHNGKVLQVWEGVPPAEELAH